MAEKEERILIARSRDYTLTDTDKGKLFEGNIEPHCANVFTRQEAIERMAKALYLFNREDEWYKEHADMYSKYMNKMAKTALNALLSKED